MRKTIYKGICEFVFDIDSLSFLLAISFSHFRMFNVFSLRVLYFYSSLFLHPHSEVAKLAPGELAQVINWAYRGKRPDADPRAWTGEREMLGGVRTSALGKLSNSDSDDLQW